MWGCGCKWHECCPASSVASSSWNADFLCLFTNIRIERLNIALLFEYQLPEVQRVDVRVRGWPLGTAPWLATGPCISCSLAVLEIQIQRSMHWWGLGVGFCCSQLSAVFGKEGVRECSGPTVCPTLCLVGFFGRLVALTLFTKWWLASLVGTSRTLYVYLDLFLCMYV